MKYRFKPNDTVMYGGYGACTLLEISEKDFGGDKKTYYVLRPVFGGSSVFYVPIDSEVLTAKIRELKSAAELRDIVRSACDAVWIEEDRARQNFLKQAVDSANTETLAAIFKLLIAKQKELADIGKKLRAPDERYMKDIENLLYEEMSFVFETTKEQVIPFFLCEEDLAEKK